MINKNDFTRIAKSIYLQQMVARQIYAAFNPEKDDIAGLGSMLQISQKLRNNFSVFIGSENTDSENVLQFIKKDGDNYKVYGLQVNGKVCDKNFIVFNSLNKLINALIFSSSTIVSQGTSFNSNLQQLNALLNNQKLYSDYMDKQSEKQVYANNTDKSIAKQQIALDIINRWLKDINKVLEDMKNQMERILLFKINNNQQGILSYISDIEVIINSSSSDYLSKVDFSKDVDNIVDQIKRSITQNSSIQSLKNQSIPQIKTMQKANLKNLNRKISNVVGKLKGILQIVQQLNKGQQEVKTINSSIIDAIKKSNTTSELSANLQKIENNDFTVDTDIIDYLESHGKNTDIPFTQKGSSQLKSKLETFSKFIFGQLSELPYQNWNDIYQNYFKYYYSDDADIISIVDNFNSFVKSISDESVRQDAFILARAYAVLTKLIGKTDIDEKQQKKIDEITTKIDRELIPNVKNHFDNGFGQKLVEYIKEYVKNRQDLKPSSYDSTQNKAKGFYPFSSLSYNIAEMSDEFQAIKKMIQNIDD